MIIIYVQNEIKIEAIELSDDNLALLEEALWIDTISPTKRDEEILEQYLHLDIPTKKEMEEIEPSSRLYIEDDAFFMTTTMVALSDYPIAKTEVVSFILTEKTLVTVRYIELNSFKLFVNKFLRSKRKKVDAVAILLGLLDSITERLADILEKISHAFDEISQTIFLSKDNHNSKNINYKQILQDIGTNGDLGTKARESMVSFIRLISFLEQSPEFNVPTDTLSHLKIVKNDIQAISDYAGFISTKVNFLLDATLGMINIEQNNIIKIFSVAAVIFLPPTLIASLYGMNFKFMPELHWIFGYPFAIFLMIMSAILPYHFFKKKNWL